MGLLDKFQGPEFAMWLSGIGRGLSNAAQPGGQFDMGNTNALLMQMAKNRKAREKMSGLMENSNLAPEQQNVLGLMAQYDPMAAAKMYGGAVFGQGQDPTAGMREYEYARQNGFQGSFMDFLNAKRASTNVNVNTGDTGPQIGTIPQGYEAYQTPQGAWQMRPIEGGPAAREVEQAQEAEQAQAAQSAKYGDVVLDEIGRIKEKLATWGLPETGMVGSALKNVPGTDAFGVSKLLDTIKANIGFERLEEMKRASPTGGALGQVTEREIAFLQATLGNLEQAQDKEDFLYNLNRLEKIYEQIMRKASAYPNAAEFGFGGAQPGGVEAGSDFTPPDKPVDQWTQEELDAYGRAMGWQ